MKSINGKGESDQFQLEFDKLFTWTVLDLDEKCKFLTTLVNLSIRKGDKIVAENLPKNVEIVELDGEDKSSKVWPLQREESEYEAISAKEAQDLMQLMEKCDHAVTNADLFVEDLSKELNILDGANIHSIMASEENIGTVQFYVNVHWSGL